MSKFLKFIVHTVIILTIICVAALAVPPFFGITTAIIEDSSKETNLPLGSVTYAKNESIKDVKKGDSLLIRDESSVYRLKVEDMDFETDTFSLIDTTDKSAEVQSRTIHNSTGKVIITIGYIGYLLVATQSLEGLIIIGLAVLFLVVLFILAEVWRKDKYVEQDDEIAEEPEETVEPEAEETEELSRRERKKLAKQQKKEEKAAMKAAKKQAKTSGFIDDPEDVVPEEEIPVQTQTVEDEAMQILKKELAEAQITPVVEELPAQEPETAVAAEEQPEMVETVEETETIEPEPEELEEEEPEPVELKKMAIPMPTVAELQKKAAEAGEEPVIKKDDISGVTTFDYSKIILSDEEEKTE